MLALWRASIRRSRADWPFALASWLLLLCATTLLAAGPVYGDAVAVQGLRGAVLRAAPADRTVRVGLSVPAGSEVAVDAVVSNALRASLSPAAAEVAEVVRTDVLTLGPGSAQASTDAARGETRVLLVAAHQGIEKHARIVAGRWATTGKTPVEATVSEGAARSLGITVGDVVRVASRSSEGAGFDVRITGTWRANEIDDGYWAGSGVEIDGSETSGSYTYQGPLELAAADLLSHVNPGYLSFEWRAILNVDGLTPDNVDTIRAELLTLDGSLREVLPASTPVVKSGLLVVLAAAADATLIERGAVLLLTLQFAIVAGYAILLVAVLIDERRRVDAALLRSRGATSAHVAALAAGEGTLLALPAVVLAPFLASGLVWALSRWGVLAGLGSSLAAGMPAIPPLSFVLAVAAGLACVVGFTLPAALAGFSLATVRVTLGRPLARAFAQRIGLDFALLVVAALAFWELRSSGSAVTTGSGGGPLLDPMLASVPAIGLLAGAVLAGRLVPRVGEVAERLLPRRRGLIPPLLGRSVARQAPRVSRISLLLVLAAALGTFAATYGATWSQSQADQAAFRSPLDLRATSSRYGTLPDWGSGSAYRALPGVTGALRVDRDLVDVGRAVRNAELIAIDAETAKTALDPDVNPSARLHGPSTVLLDSLGTGRLTTDAISLPRRARRLVVQLDADLSVALSYPPGPGVPVPRQAVDVSVVIADADGLHRIRAGSAAVTGSGQRLVVPLEGSLDGVAYRVAPDAQLEAVELSISVSSSAQVTGRVDLTDVASSSTDDGSDWTSLHVVGAAGWAWAEALGESVVGYAGASSAPGRVVLDRQDRAAQGQLLDGHPVVLRFWAPPAAAAGVPVLVSDAFVAASGAGPGEEVSASVGGYPLSFSIVGQISSLAPVDPATPLVVVDGPTLSLVRYATWGMVRDPAEWWLSVSGDPAAVAHRLTADPFDCSAIVDRAVLEQSMRSDPVAAGIVGALALGGLATVVMALVGFLVGATATLRDRRPELAALRALGVSPSGATWWLTLEQGLLVALSLAVGWILGDVLAWLTLPAAAFSTGGAAAVPQPAIVIPLAVAASLAAFGALLILAAGAAARRVVGAIAIGPLLRDEGR
jgi:hypothetical protein